MDSATEWGIRVPINGEPKERSNVVLLINPINVLTKVVLPSLHFNTSQGESSEAWTPQ